MNEQAKNKRKISVVIRGRKYWFGKDKQVLSIGFLRSGGIL